VGRSFEDLLAFLLGYAAEHGKGFALVVALELLEAVEDFLLGLIADGASVVENQIGGFRRFNLPVAFGK